MHENNEDVNLNLQAFIDHWIKKSLADIRLKKGNYMDSICSLSNVNNK